MQARTRGFTIIEILVSLLLFTIMLSSLYATWRLILRTSRVGQELSDTNQKIRIAAEALQTALSSAIMFEHNVRLYAFEVDNSGYFPRLSFVSRLPSGFIGSGLFGGLQTRRVTFEAETNRLGKIQLVLKQWPVMFEVKEQQLGHPFQYSKIPLVDDLVVFQVEFSDGRTDQWLDQWINPISKTPWTNELPRAVRFVIAAASTGKTNWLLRTVLIPSRPVRRVYQGILGVPAAPTESGDITRDIRENKEP